MYSRVKVEFGRCWFVISAYPRLRECGRPLNAVEVDKDHQGILEKVIEEVRKPSTVQVVTMGRSNDTRRWSYAVKLKSISSIQQMRILLLSKKRKCTSDLGQQICTSHETLSIFPKSCLNRSSRHIPKAAQ